MSWSFSYHGNPRALAEAIRKKEEKSFPDKTEQAAYDSARDMILRTLAANTNEETTLYVQATGHAGGGFCQNKVIVDSQPHTLMAAWPGALAE